MDYQGATLVRENFIIEESNLTFQTSDEGVHFCLKKHVTNYLNEHPQLSLRSISLRSGVSFTTLSRLTKLNSSTLSPHVVLNLSAFLWKEYKLDNLVDKIPHVLSKYLLEHFGRFIILKH